MKLKKSDEIIKIEKDIKKAKLKQKENIKKINLEFTETILNKLKEDDNFKNDLKNLLSKYSLNNSIDLLNKNYGAFKIKQKNKEKKKEEN